MASRLQMAVRVPQAMGISSENGKYQAQGRHHDAEQSKAIPTLRLSISSERRAQGRKRQVMMEESLC